jgi:hypothetical protein
LPPLRLRPCISRRWNERSPCDVEDPATNGENGGASALVLAQQSVSDLKEVDDDDVVVQPFDRTVDDLEDMDLKTAAGEEIGEVEEVLMDGSGQPVALAIEVDELLDLDDEERVFRLDQLRLDGDDLVTDLSNSEIEALPAWDE